MTLVGTTFFDPSVLARLRTLTDRELAVCVLHLAEGQSQAAVAEWLGISPRTVQRNVQSAVKKVPEMQPLRDQHRRNAPRPVVVHLGQLSRTDREAGPFNADEL